MTAFVDVVTVCFLASLAVPSVICVVVGAHLAWELITGEEDRR